VVQTNIVLVIVAENFVAQLVDKIVVDARVIFFFLRCFGGFRSGCCQIVRVVSRIVVVMGKGWDSDLRCFGGSRTGYCCRTC